MSLDDTKRQIAQTVIDPWNHFRKLAASLNQTHNESLQYLANEIFNLVSGQDGQTAMQGAGADGLAEITTTYIEAAQKLTGSDNSFLCQRLSEAARLCEKYAHELDQKLAAILVPEQDGGMLAGAALALDTGAAVQGGVDVPWDVVAGVVTVIAIAGSAYSSAQAESAAIDEATSTTSTLEADWQTDVTRGPNTEPLDDLPTDPQSPGPGGKFDFFKALGIYGGAALLLGSLGLLTWNQIKNDKSKRQQLLEMLQKEFPECDQAWLEQFLDAHPDLPLDQIIRALQAMRLQAQYQALLNEIDVLKDPRLAKIRKMVLSNLKALQKMDPLTITDANIAGFLGNLNGLNAEYQLALQYIQSGQLQSNGAKIPFTYTDAAGKQVTTYLDVDDIITTTDANGNPVTKWVEIKNYKPFSLNSSDWSDPKKGLQTDIDRYIQAAKEKGVNDIEIDFPRGVGDDVKQAIEDMGRKAGINITVNTPPIPPAPDPGSSWCTS